MAEQQIQEYRFQGQPVRFVWENGEPWWVAKDIADTLGYIWAGSATIKHVPAEWRGVKSVPTPSGVQEMAVLSEQGLYFFLGRSDKPMALPFQKWLAGEVVPSIRKTGAYHVQPVTPTEALLQAVQILAEQERQLRAIQEAQEQQREQLTILGHRVDSLDLTNIDGTPRQRLEKMVKRYAWSKGISYQVGWRDFDQAFNTAFRTNLTALRRNFADRHGMETISRPEYLERTGRLEDAIRMADKLLVQVRRAGA